MKPYTYLIGWTKLGISYYGVRYAQDCDPSDLWNPYKTSSDKVKEHVKEFGTPDVIQVRRTFTDAQTARLWEERVLKRMKVVSSDKWLNQHDSLAPPINPLGNLRMKEPALRKKASDNNKGSGNPNYGKKANQITCPHCNKTAGANTYARWHGDNCPVYNPTAFRPTGKNGSNFGGGISQITASCIYCKRTHDIRNHTRHHGKNCKSNLTNLVANTDLDVYNN